MRKFFDKVYHCYRILVGVAILSLGLLHFMLPTRSPMGTLDATASLSATAQAASDTAVVRSGGDRLAQQQQRASSGEMAESVRRPGKVVRQDAERRHPGAELQPQRGDELTRQQQRELEREQLERERDILN
jgi:hypothetical protein